MPAAGRGARTGLDFNKVLAPLHGQPLLLWTLRALTHRDALPENVVCREVFVVARREEWGEIEVRVLAPLRAELASQDAPELRLIEGGASRQSSVLAGVLAASGELVSVHDAARPLLAPSLCAKVVEAACECGAAIAAGAAHDTVKIARDASQVEAQVLATPVIERTVARDTVFLAQTPQVFRRELLLSALQNAAREGFAGTDCASLVENLQDAPPIALVCDGSLNLKVTRREDLEIAALFLLRAL